MTEATQHVHQSIHTDCMNEININSNLQNISQTYLDALKNYVISSLPNPLKNKYFTYERIRILFYQMILNHFY